MRVLVIHTRYQQKGGEDTVVGNEVELLRAGGDEVELLLFSNEGQTLLKVLQMPFNWSSYRTTCARIKVFKPDVVHIHNLHYAGSPSVIYAVRHMKVPMVLTLHNYRLLCPSATLFYQGKLFTASLNELFPVEAAVKGVYLNSRVLTSWVGLSMLLHKLLGTWKIPDRYITLSRYSQKIYQCRGFHQIVNKMVVKPNFCYNPPALNPADEHFYLYVGRLSEEKGIEVLLKAFAESGHVIKIAGNGPLREMVQDYGTQHANIQYLGIQDRGHIDALMNTATALVFPSEWYETFGMVVIEAFAAGTPVIASGLGPIKDLVEDKVDGLQFKAGDAKDLCRKIWYYEELSTGEKKSYRRYARLKYEQLFSPAVNAGQLSRIYNQLMAG